MYRQRHSFLSGLEVRLSQVFVMVDAHVACPGRKPARRADSSPNPFLTARLVSSSQVPVYPLPNQLRDGFPCLGGGLPQSLHLTFGQLNLGTNHTNVSKGVGMLHSSTAPPLAWAPCLVCITSQRTRPYICRL